LQPFVDELPREIDARAILEDRSDLGETVARYRAGVLQSRQAGDRRLDREGDALFGFERGKARRLAVDLDLDVGDVGGGVNRQALEAPDADRAEQNDNCDDRPAKADCSRNQSFKQREFTR